MDNADGGQLVSFNSMPTFNGSGLSAPIGQVLCELLPLQAPHPYLNYKTR